MRGIVLVGAAVLLLGGCAGTTVADKEPLSAEAALKDKDGKDVGRATLIEGPDGLRVAITAYRMPPGPKGVRITSAGACQPPQFVSAGPARPVELPAMTVGAAGEGGLDVTTKAATLGAGPNALLAGAGSAIVVHANPGAAGSDGTGSGGTRIACGVLVK